MQPRLPLVEPHEREHTYCKHCPKLCRFACPVSTAQGRETTTPWGKMTSLHYVSEGALDFEPAHAATWWACTGCMRCRTFCDHGNEVAATLNAGRAEALRAGVAPGAAREVVDGHPAREGRAAEAARALFGEALERRTPVAFVPGCTGCVTGPEDVAAGHRATEALTGAKVGVVGDRCCGLPLLEAGDRDGFLRAAERFLRGFEHADTVVFQDPGCLHALARIAPSLGLTAKPRLQHLSEVAAAHLRRLSRVPVEGPVRYHDPCRLGRGMGIYDPPRTVLTRVTGQPPEEMPQRRDRAECSGAGGQLPRTDPETAAAIADERLADHALVGGGTLVTACPSAKRAFERRGGRVIELGSLIGRAVSPEPGSSER